MLASLKQVRAASVPNGFCIKAPANTGKFATSTSRQQSVISTFPAVATFRTE